MIDPQDIDNTIVMSETEFQSIANQGNNGALINVVEIENGKYAIFGPSGVYQSSNGERVFNDLSDIHKVFSNWGLKRFIQGGYLKTF